MVYKSQEVIGINIVFLTINYNLGGNGIYQDLMLELAARGHRVHVVCARQRRLGKPTELAHDRGIEVLQVRTGNITRSNVLEKGLATLAIESQFIKAIEAFWPSKRFDLILYSTPPITFERVVRLLKERHNARTYLLLKDIFPQNAVDIGMMHDGGLIHRYFRAKERRLYAQSDYIGCMSPANVRYVIAHNPWVSAARVEVCPNSVRPRPTTVCDPNTRSSIRSQYGIPNDACVFVYGGNLGKPQGISFLIEVIEAASSRSDVFFLIVGAGTEFRALQAFLDEHQPGNAMLMNNLPKAEYESLLAATDVGLIFLDKRFTIPNYPSRLLSYLQQAMPVLAATDVNSDIKDTLSAADCGFWAESGDLVAFMSALSLLADDATVRTKMGQNGRRYLEEHCTVARSADILLAHFQDEEATPCAREC